MSELVAQRGADNPLAILCGGGSLPFAVADAVIGRGRRVFMFGLRGWTDAVRIVNYPHDWGRLAQFGLFCRRAREQGCREVVFIGTVMRPGLWQLRPDLFTLRLLPRIAAAFRGGDDHLLSGVARIFEQHGFRLVGAHEVAPEILMPTGVLTRRRPSPRDEADIARGMALLAAMGPFDIGQAAVVADHHVLAMEAAEGTDNMLARVAELRSSGRIGTGEGVGVMIKGPKPGQDHRFDLPTIGPQTVAGIARAGLSGLAVAAGAAIVAEPEQVVRDADAEGLFVIGVSGDRSAS